MRVSVLVALLFVAAPVGPALASGADASPDLGNNAALQYWQAFAVLPTLDKTQEAMLEHWNEAPLDAPALKLVEKAKPSLMYLRRGTEQARCAWGLDYDDGVDMLLPHLGKVRTLARLQLLHARQEFSQKHMQEAADEAAALFVLARHAGCDPILIAALVSYSIDYISVETLARELPGLDASALKKVSWRLDTLPPAPTVAEAVETEKQIGGLWLSKKLKEAEQRKPGSWRDVLAYVASTDKTFRLSDVHSLDEALRFIRQALPLYDRMSQLLALPRSEYLRQYRDVVASVDAANPIARLLLPVLDAVRGSQDRHNARMALFRAGIAVVQNGPDALKGIRDPFGDGPFEYRRLDRGFELRSKLVLRGEPVTLTFGQGK